MMILGGGLYSFFSQTQSSKMSLPSRANRTSMFSAMNGRGELRNKWGALKENGPPG
jgi:hypothetical protein